MRDYRKEAKAALRKAKKYDSNHILFVNNVQNYTDCIEKFLQIEPKIDEDFRNLESIYTRLALFHFNRHTDENYQKARDYYIKAIEVLITLDNKTDKDLRDFVQNYIDLADVYMHLKNNEQSDIAIYNAIKAFNCIQIKTQEEIELGNPSTNLKAFIHYFEKNTATKRYLNGSSFQNHTTMFVENQNEKNMMQSFGTIFIDEEKQEQQELRNKMQAMGFGAPVFFSNFKKEGPEDSSLRAFALQCLSLSKEQLDHKKYTSALNAYQKALDTFNQIQEKSEEDVRYIQAIEEQIKTVKELPKPTLRSAKTKITFSFEQSNNNTNDKIEDIEDISMNIEYK